MEHFVLPCIDVLLLLQIKLESGSPDSTPPAYQSDAAE